ncbi:hypothetical protein Syun_023869 [Stephania yunnanensis]|uniref:Dynein light chain n=1 Tax=Stephania yunnanensis TaxID=152371 RepID=A0AAP0FP88_9MAGN
MDPTSKKRQIPAISTTSITPPPPPSLSDPLLNFKSLTLSNDDKTKPSEAEEDPKRVSTRRSFCGDAKIELSSFFVGVGARVVAVDMPPFMQIHAVSCARKTYNDMDRMSSKTLACAVKKEFDGVYGPAWHCIVGNSFGSFVTHSVGGFMYFSLDHKLYVLLFKTSVQKAD